MNVSLINKFITELQSCFRGGVILISDLIFHLGDFFIHVILGCFFVLTVH